MGANFLCQTLDGKMSQGEVSAFIKNKSEDDLVEYGHDPYAGEWGRCPGVQFQTKTFNSTEEAIEYLEEKCEKWGKALAVKVTGVMTWKSNDSASKYKLESDEKLKSSKRYQSTLSKIVILEEKIKKILSTIREINDETISKIKGSKKRIECEGCNCAITPDKLKFINLALTTSYSINYIEKDLTPALTASCPVCLHKLKINALERALASKVEKYNSMHVERSELKLKVKETIEKQTIKIKEKYMSETTAWVVGYLAAC